MAQPDRERFKHATFVEEAHHILLRKKQETTGEETVTDVILREIRELGEAIVCLDQHPSLISKPALGNTYVTFAFNLKHRGDLAMMQDCLLLDGEQTDYLGRLEVGWAVVKLQGRWFWPFLVKLPLVRVDKGKVTDRVIAECAALLPQTLPEAAPQKEADSPPIPVSEENSAPEKTQDEATPGIPSGGKNEEEEGENGCAIRLTTQERKFLLAVHERPESLVVDRYLRLRLSARKGNEVQRALKGRGLIESAHVSLASGTGKILALTDKGRQALGLRASPSGREGGPVHAYWKRRLAGHLRARGYDVTEEYAVGGGKAIDLVATRDGKRIAFEIETGQSDAAANVRKCLDAGLDRVVVVATGSPAERAVAALRAHPRAEVVAARELLETGHLPGERRRRAADRVGP
ncbi:MAG: hypothetical protein FJ288_02695 [Planctomycetes bacterium]|nr:hypothetical protein [Planctomycetota bacterium]